MNRINIGCGMTPVDGWLNFDNSFSLKLASHPTLAALLSSLHLLNKPQLDYISFCQRQTIQWADATKRIPLASNSVEVLYSSHMLEHLDRHEAMLFLIEARRVLMRDGIVRIAVPDIKRRVEAYVASEDADSFLESTHICSARPRTLLQKLRLLIVGERHHQWMYDAKSLCKLLRSAGFSDPTPLKPGETKIDDPKNLNLWERWDESVYVEARNQ